MPDVVGAVILSADSAVKGRHWSHITLAHPCTVHYNETLQTCGAEGRRLSAGVSGFTLIGFPQPFVHSVQIHIRMPPKKMINHCKKYLLANLYLDSTQ